jgi:putative transposase
LEEDAVEIMAEITRSLAEHYDMQFERQGGDRRHIHLLYPADPKIVPGQMVLLFKSITDQEVFRRKPAFKKELGGEEFWSYGHYVGTVGKRGNWRIVQPYVQELGKQREELRQLTLF